MDQYVCHWFDSHEPPEFNESLSSLVWQQLKRIRYRYSQSYYCCIPIHSKIKYSTQCENVLVLEGELTVPYGIYTDMPFVENSGTELKGLLWKKTTISQMPKVEEKLCLHEQMGIT